MDTSVGSVRCPLLIGRDDLLELADRRLDDVLAGRGHFLLVAGEAGIGKTRFLDAVVQKAEERGFANVWGYVAPQDRDVPAASVLDMARSMLRMPAFEGLGRDLLALRDATIEAEQVRRRQLVMDVVDRILAVLSGPTVLGFEDLQWADDLSLEIIAELARRSRDRQVLLCGGYRTDEALPGTSLRDWRSRWITQRIAEEVRLTPLSQAETALVTTLILDTGLPAPREVVAAVYERTDGIPLHIEELLGALSAEARANGLAIREATVPDTIEDAVLARLSHRSAEAQAVAKAGAIIGRCFSAEVLAGIMDLPQDAIEQPLQELIDDFVLEPPGPRGVFDFRHQLLRDAIYRSVPVGERRRFHARAGEFGAQLEGASEIHSSLHYERAGLLRLAFETALTGARDAARLSAHREAFDLYRRTIDNMPDDLVSAERGRILEAYSQEAGAIEENAIAEQCALDAAAAFRQAGDPVHAIGTVADIVLGTWRRNARPISERTALADALWAELEAVPDSGDPTETLNVRANVAIRIAITKTDAGAFAEARTWMKTAREIAEQLGDRQLLSMVDWKDGVIDVITGDIVVGMNRVGDTAHSAEAAGDEETGVSAFRDAATLAARTMDYKEATRWINEGLRYADSIEQSHCAHVMSATCAMVSWAEARWGEAATVARQAVADHGCRRAAETARWALGYVELGRGALDDATTELTQALEFGEESQAIDLILPPLWGLAEVALQRGQPDRAVAMSRDALERARLFGERILLVPFVVTGVRAAQAAGRPAAASAWFDEIAAELGTVPDVADAALEHGRGLVALADGATGVARVALEAAVSRWDAKDRVWEGTWARLDLAQCLIRSNRFAEALSLAVEARTVASRLDSRPLAERADALQRMARGRVAVDEPWRPLTAREFAVARLISEGLTNAEIADSLGIAPKTASSHVEHILAKLGASRRAEIATWASNVDRATNGRTPALH
ncbi:MAG TPA: AAA family ATPase [Candidatus Limnocylindrales bacterium]|nr:AAA family ATPase [Candidatus Limnocylindrales bacterium]